MTFTVKNQILNKTHHYILLIRIFTSASRG